MDTMPNRAPGILGACTGPVSGSTYVITRQDWSSAQVLEANEARVVSWGRRHGLRSTGTSGHAVGVCTVSAWSGSFRLCRRVW